MARDRTWWQRWWKRLLVVAGVIVALLVGASAVAARFTESDRFCGSDCHEMWPYRDTWEKSAHKGHRLRGVPHPAGSGELRRDQAGRLARGLGPLHRPGEGADQGHAAHPRLRLPAVRLPHRRPDRARRSSSGPRRPSPSTHAGAGHAGRPCIACHAALVHAGAPGVTAPPANSMPSCFTCHPGGTKDCGYCHEAPHGDRGPCADCHSIKGWGAGGRRTAPRRAAHRQARPGRLRDVPHPGRRREAGRLRGLPRRRAQRARRLRALSHAQELGPVPVHASAGG